jgi:formylglycine-generating enzyme required for sulfatase activity
MKLFLSHANEDRPLAELIAFSIRGRGHNVFLDEDDLPAGRNYDEQIERAVKACDAFVFLISPDSVAGGRYTLTELSFARSRWKDPHGRVLPVMVRKTPLDQVPPYLKAVTILEPVGNIAAETSAAVDRLIPDRRGIAFLGRYGIAIVLCLGIAGAMFSVIWGRLIEQINVPPAPLPSTGSKCMEVSISGAQSRCVIPGSGESVWFKDCSDCPEMVLVPALGFTMGSPEDEPERPIVGETQIAIRIQKPFAVGRYAVTRAEFEAFVRAKKYETEEGCHATTSSGWEQRADLNWKSPGFSQDDFHPVVCVDWNDANAYVKWLREITNKSYRLLSETEREFVARTAWATPFWWGSTISTDQANYNGTYAYNHGPLGENRKRTVRVDSFIVNPWGLYNVHGNVWEWTADCWNENNTGNPGTGEPRDKIGDCNLRIVRGGSWFSKPSALRAAFRFKDEVRDRSVNGGFRVARDLSP